MKSNERDMGKVYIPAEHNSRVQICMTRVDLLQDIRARISPAARAALRDDTVQNISQHRSHMFSTESINATLPIIGICAGEREHSSLYIYL